MFKLADDKPTRPLSAGKDDFHSGNKLVLHKKRISLRATDTHFHPIFLIRFVMLEM